MVSALVIQDDNNLRNALCEILELHGIQAFRASNGNEGIQLARLHRPDVIVTDYRLPDVFGWKVAFDILQSPSLLDTPIILMSASQPMPEIAEYQPLFDAFVPLPFDVDDWLNQIDQQIRHNI